MSDETTATGSYSRTHLRFGWWSLLVFLTLGLGLELLHGFKVRLYLDVSNDTRRLMWTLAHAHGALLGVVHVVFGLYLRVVGAAGLPRLHLVSICLMAASLLLPGGFFLGGVSIYGGDPGMGVALVPVGAVSLLTAVLLTARSTASVAADRGPAKKKGGRS